MSARDIIKRSEGLRLTAYPDPASGGVPFTIGWGSTRNVHKGMTITIAEAEHRLDEDMGDAFACIDNSVTVPLDYRQRDALCSFVFNVGCRAFQKSTMLRLLNAGDYTGAAAQFPRWNKGAGKVMPGLVKRRAAERALFLTGTNVVEPAFPQENTEMAPFLAAAVPALISALPEFARIFAKPDVAERNVEAAVKASEIIMTATGTSNVQAAVEKIEADPEIAASANEALRMSRADLMDAMQKAWEADEKSVADARDFYRNEKPVLGQWHFVHLLSALLVIVGSLFAGFVIFTSDDPGERAMVLQVILMTGFVSVIAFWLGSSRSSQVKDLIRK